MIMPFSGPGSACSSPPRRTWRAGGGGPARAAGLASLSGREKQVLELLAQGHTNQEMAKKLFLSVKTVETYRARIAEKLGLRTRAEVVRYALELGLLGPGGAS